ncbi:MAG: RagB/SusD family nutrient uptake outer membrane protein [Candidatus Pseudobacter hemicellulosilyticus]|uniref:RagB/SusD family nutrient uptake outer membrane protein n=1 Tax=Candidatus Pseudobacter hemicellulosilyticus TaxID=3121375 RepID=A0AAJ5WXE2_9BACT|nr:MAG: RagB/SusD family nutrient uptake outer membrane protein [Pseudobacter sp.]
MKSKYIASLFLCSTLFSASCKKFLDVVPTEITSSTDIWGNIDNADKNLANLYKALPSNSFYSTSLWASTDEAMNHWEGPSELLFNYGSWGPGNNPLDEWGGRFGNVRAANLYIANIEKVPLTANQIAFYTPIIPRLKAEARFLRAIYYFELFKRYGGVPIITEALDLNDPKNSELPRNSADEVANFIVSELNEITPLLPLTYEIADYGRITRGAALALKARVLLYAASPLFNGNTLYAEVKNSDGKALFNQAYSADKWKQAADAAKAVLDLNIYSLSNPTPENPVNTYAQLFYNREYAESILWVAKPQTRDLELDFLPNGASFKGNGKLSLLQELVDAYEMKNGYPINQSGSGYSAQGFWDGQMWDGLKYSDVKNISNMYKDRDPRFYASVFFQYSVWRLASIKRPVKLAWWGNNNSDGDGWPKTGTNCVSGYNLRKYCSPNVDRVNGQGNANRNAPIIRLAEVYLNYAEAMNEYLGAPDQSVYDAINAVRARVGMPALPIISSDATKEGMRQRIRNERRVELAFEGHRFWDVRRWMIATQVDNTDVHGMNSRPTTAELAATGLDVNSEAAGVAVFYKQVVIQSRSFQSKHYLMPIPPTEIDKDKNLVQNFGW